jgi:hypothetical protein
MRLRSIKKADNTSFLSATHATDSTWSGCRPNKRAVVILATIALS